MPNSPGSTAMMPPPTPPTPLLAGRPTRQTHSPAKSTLPQVVDLAVHRGDSDHKIRRVGLGQLGDVGGQCAGVQAGVLLVELGLDRRLGLGGSRLGTHTPGFQNSRAAAGGAPISTRRGGAQPHQVESPAGLPVAS